MKIDINRLKAPMCFLVMTLVAIALLGFMSNGEMQESEEADSNQQISYDFATPADADFEDSLEFCGPARA